MKPEKHIEALREVKDEIDKALNDPKGVLNHQRRLGLMISLGIAEIIELYFHKLRVFKEGSSIKHEWFKRNEKNIKDKLENQLIIPVVSVENIDKIIETARKIEENRNTLAYGSPLSEEQILLDEINMFLQIKKLIEDKTGDII